MTIGTIPALPVKTEKHIPARILKFHRIDGVGKLQTGVFEMHGKRAAHRERGIKTAAGAGGGIGGGIP